MSIVVLGLSAWMIVCRLGFSFGVGGLLVCGLCICMIGLGYLSLSKSLEKGLLLDKMMIVYGELAAQIL